MQLLLLAPLLSALAAVAAGERILGVYIFHRHGDRSAKAWKPVKLTALGAEQAHASGLFYRSRYLTSSPNLRITGLSPDTARLSKLAVTTPHDSVLYSSALSFLQGLYPPSGRADTLANGSRVEAPLGGYQYIPVRSASEAASGDKAESNAWLQGGSGCAQAILSSNRYLSSDDYRSTYDQSLDFYQGLLPVINGTFGQDKANFKYGYSVFDLINVATIHNSSIPSASLLTTNTRQRLYNLASEQEWNLAYNASEPIRAIAGSMLAGQILSALETIVDAGASAPRFNIQFGAYGTFMSFFGLAQLPAASADFYGICNYASSMAFELVTSVADDAEPRADDISVRFLFANGSAAENPLRPFPLFGQPNETLRWSDFKAGMSSFAIANTSHWCDVCGNTAGRCAFKAGSGPSSPGAASVADSAISRPVAGVIGALVAIAVVIGLQVAVIFFGGLRLTKKSRCSRVSSTSSDTSEMSDPKA